VGDGGLHDGFLVVVVESVILTRLSCLCGRVWCDIDCPVGYG